MNLVETGIRARRKTAGVIRRRFPSRKLTFHLGSAGQLGNQLWQIAGTIAIARRNGAEAVFRNDWPYRPFFAIPEARYASRLSAARCHEAWPLATSIVEEWRHHICANSTFSWWGAFMSSDPSPIVPWLLDVSPEAFRAARPAHWRELEIASDPLEAPAQPHLRSPPPHPGLTAGRGTWARPGRVAPAFRDDS